MSDKLRKVTKQITKAKSLDSAKDDLVKGKRDTDLLIPNSQPMAVNKEKACTSKYQQPIHDIPSSIIILTEEEKLENAIEGIKEIKH